MTTPALRSLREQARLNATEYVYAVAAWGGRSPEFMQAQVGRLAERFEAFAVLALKEAEALAKNPYSDEVRALGTNEPFEVGRKIATAIASLRKDLEER